MSPKISLQVVLDLINYYLAGVASDYPRADDAVFLLQEALRQEADNPGSSEFMKSAKS